MRKVTKRLSYSLLIFFGLLIAAAWILPPYMDWNKYRGQVETIASSILDQQVRVEGDVALTLLPSPTVTADNVRLLGTDGADDIASIEALHIKIDTLAMLGGSLAVSEFQLDTPRLTLIEQENVGWGVAGFGSDNGDKGEGLSLENVVINDGVITLIPLSGARGTLNGLNMSFSGTVPDGPWQSAGDFSFRDVPIAFETRMQPLSDGKSQSMRFVATSGNAELELTGRVMQAGAFNGRMKLSAEKASEVGETLWALIDDRGPSIMPEEPLFIDVRVDRTVGKIDLQSRRVQLGESEGNLELLILGQGTRRFTGTLGLGQLNLDLWHFENARSSEKAVDGIPPWSENLAGNFTVTAEALTWHDQLVRQVELEIVADDQAVTVNKAQALVPGGGQISFGGRIDWADEAQSFKGRVGLNTGRLRDFLTWAGMDVATLPENTLMSLNWTADITSDWADWSMINIDGKLDDSTISGTLSGTYAGSINGFDLVTDRLNLDRYWPKALSQSPIERLPATMRATADVLSWDGVNYRDLSFEAIGRGRSIEIKNLSATAFDGTIEITLSSDNVNGWTGLSGNYSLENINLKQVSYAYPQLGDIAMRVEGPVRAYGGIAGNKAALSLDPTILTKEVNLVGALTLGFSEEGLQTITADGRAAVESSRALLHDIPALSDAGAGSFTYAVEGAWQDVLKLTLTGSIGAHTITFDGETKVGEDRIYSGDVTFAVLTASGLLPTYLKTDTGVLEGSLNISKTKDMITLSQMDVRHPNGTIKGDVQYGLGENQILGGMIIADRITLFEYDSNSPSRFANDWKQTLFEPLPLREKRGSIAVTLTSSRIMGQAVDDATGTLVTDDNGWGLNLESASVNNEPASLALRLNEGAGDTLSFDVNLSVDRLRYEPMMTGLFGPVVQKAEGPFSLTVSGNGRTEHALVRTLRGEGQMAVTAGTLRFMDAPALITGLNEEQDRGEFVKSLSAILDGGASEISTANATFKIERGIVTIAPLTAVGDWGTLTLPGTMDIDARTVDFKGSVTLKEPVTMAPIGLSFAGPVTAPKPKYDTVSLVRFADRVIGDRLKNQLTDAQKAALEANGGSVEPTGRIFDLVKDVLKKTKPKEEPKSAPSSTPVTEKEQSEDPPAQTTE